VTPPNDAPEMPRPTRRKAVWPGIVWSVPLAAVLIVGYLGLRGWANRGEIVTVTFRTAADAQPDETKVIYQGVEAGQLVKISPNKDGHRLDFTLRLRPEAKPGLNSNARFWLIGATPNLSDLSSLKAVVSGVTVGYAPGEGGTPQDHFEGLDKAPVVLPGDHGTHFVLDARTLGSIREGSDLLFHGQPIGKVTGVKFDAQQAFKVDVFLFAPYDALVKPGVRFWRISPLRISLAGGALNATLAPASTLLAGGIDLEITTAEPGSQTSPADASFPLYSSKAAARQGLSGPTVRYDFAFSAAAGGELEEDSAVTLLGFQIGEVDTARLAFDASGKPYTTVTAVLYPQQMALKGPASAADAAWRSISDAEVRKLLKLGFRARLQQTPPLIGSQGIALVQVKNAGAADLTDEGANPRIPSAPGSSDIDDISTQADQILAKVNSIPIEQIGRNLNQITGRLNQLVSAPEMTESIEHLKNTLAQIDKMLSDVEPQIGPLVSKLNEAAGQISSTTQAVNRLLEGQGSAANGSLPEALEQLSEASRSIRSLAEYLDRHPEALIRGKRPDK
jgi:paraquat-inducible protein B